MTPYELYIDFFAMLVLFLFGALGYVAAASFKRRFAMIVSSPKKCVYASDEKDSQEAEDRLLAEEDACSAMLLDKRCAVKRRAKRQQANKAHKGKAPQPSPNDEVVIPMSTESNCGAKERGSFSATPAEAEEASARLPMAETLPAPVDVDEANNLLTVVMKKSSRKARKQQSVANQALPSPAPDVTASVNNEAMIVGAVGKISVVEPSTDATVCEEETENVAGDVQARLDEEKDDRAWSDDSTPDRDGVSPQRIVWSTVDVDDDGGYALQAGGAMTVDDDDDASHRTSDVDVDVCAQIRARMAAYEKPKQEEEESDDHDSSTSAGDRDWDDVRTPSSWKWSNVSPRGFDGGKDDERRWKPKWSASWNKHVDPCEGSWNEDPKMDDWMIPFGDLITTQIVKETDESTLRVDEIGLDNTQPLLPSMDTPMFYDVPPPMQPRMDTPMFYDVPPPTQPLPMDTDCHQLRCNDHQIPPQFQPCLSTDGQQQLYTDGDFVYMLACVEVPTAPMGPVVETVPIANGPMRPICLNDAIPFASAPAKETAGSPRLEADAIYQALDDLSNDEPDSVDAEYEYLTDDEFEARPRRSTAWRSSNVV